VAGLPVCSLAFLPLNSQLDSAPGNATLPLRLNNETTTEVNIGGEQWTVIQSSSALISNPVDRIWLFVLLLALSGVFSSTFTLTFAYISDTLADRSDRVSAYGLALATFGFSFTIGPIAGGYIATHSQDPAHRPVFVAALILTTLDLFYIYFFLPETVTPKTNNNTNSFSIFFNNISYPSFNIFYKNTLLQKVAQIAFLYYTSLWAIISTLIIYAVNRFHLAPDSIGHLISALGFSTMLAEAFLVRMIVPLLGEKRSMQLGLLAFSLQCFTLAFAYRSWHLFLSVAFSALSNLVYPSLTSLLTSAVPPQSVGEVLGAVNGIKALTEGLGPFIFGMLMTFTEDTILPGSPYLVAACLSYLAYMLTHTLPDEHDEDYTLDKCSSLSNLSSSCRPSNISLFTSFTPAYFQQSVHKPCSTASSIMNHDKQIEMNSQFRSLLSNQGNHDEDDDDDDNCR